MRGFGNRRLTVEVQVCYCEEWWWLEIILVEYLRFCCAVWDWVEAVAWRKMEEGSIHFDGCLWVKMPAENSQYL